MSEAAANQMLDLEKVRIEVFEKLNAVYIESIVKHGPWCNVPDIDQNKAIKEEYLEWLGAHADCDIHGKHGEIAELYHLANCCLKRIMALTCPATDRHPCSGVEEE